MTSAEPSCVPPLPRTVPAAPAPRAIVRLTANVVREKLSQARRARVPEPMVMDDPDSVAAFHAVDPLLQLPIYRFNATAMSRLLPAGGSVLDLGSGSGRLLAHLAQARADVRAVGTDLAPAMLAAGRAALRDDGLADRVELREADFTRLPGDLPTAVDLVSTVWALHHLPGEDDLRRCLAGIARIRQTSGCAVWIFDFARLRRQATTDAIIALNPTISRRLREDGIASERAAWSASELRTALDDAGLHDLQGGPERRIGAMQAYFARRLDGGSSGHGALWTAQPLQGGAQQVLRRLCGGIPTP
jgi:tRNA (cmo5U34)-methyltransferase